MNISSGFISRTFKTCSKLTEIELGVRLSGFRPAKYISFIYNIVMNMGFAYIMWHKLFQSEHNNII